MACLALHDKAAPDKSFLALLPLIEKGARDERNFVKKGVNWALRGIGRRNLALNAAALAVARRLALSEEAALPMGRQRRAARADEPQGARAARSTLSVTL